jgi:hypothetical protein
MGNSTTKKITLNRILELSQPNASASFSHSHSIKRAAGEIKIVTTPMISATSVNTG